MSASNYVEIYLGDVVQMRKKHPCGGFVWQVVRVGVDVGLVCQTCQRRVMLPRGKFNKQVKKILQRAPNTNKDA